ncbi:MAG: hypothetical protein ACKOPE_10130 [Novosphingobium sp.]
MKTSSFGTVWRALLAMLLLAAAYPAQAEKLTFDHRLYPPLKEVLDSGDAGMIAYDASNPRYVIDLIAIRGKSASDWSEALEIIARTPAKSLRSARDWFDELRRGADRRCANTFTMLAEGPASLTFERRSPDCPAERAGTEITRVLAGKRSLFRITFLFKGVPDESARQQALALLASAHLE